MRDYGKIKCSIWNSQKFRSLKSDRARLLYLYLHTCSGLNSIGCFEIKPGYAATDLEWPVKVFDSAITDLSNASLIEWHPGENVVRIVDYLKHDPPTNPKHAAGSMKLAFALPEIPLKRKVLLDLAQAPYCVGNADLAGVLAKGSDSPIEALRNPEPEPEPEPINISVDATRAMTADFEAWYEVYPRHIARQSAAKAYFRARADVGSETLLAGARRYGQSRIGEDPKFTKHPATWLNGGCWADETSPKSTNGNGGQPAGGARASYDRLLVGLGESDELKPQGDRT